MIEEHYLSNQEYKTFYESLNNLRIRVVNDLPIKSNMEILDIGCGYGYFTVEVAKHDTSSKVTGIDISKQAVRKAAKHIKLHNLEKRVNIIEMDATRMQFGEKRFDMVVNFTGLEDIHMTRGRTGVLLTFVQANRVLRPSSYFCFVIMPTDEMETVAQKTEVALYSYICDATWLRSAQYEKMLDEAGFRLVQRQKYYTEKKLTPNQAKLEIKYACKSVPQIYGVDTPTFAGVWSKFGKQIEKHGLGHYSKVVLMIAQKCKDMQ